MTAHSKQAFFSECGTWGVMLGDCLERLQELQEGCADLVLIDPPYGTIRGITGMKSWERGALDWDDAIAPDVLLREICRILRPNGRASVFSQEPYTSRLETCEAVPELRFIYRAIWKKNSPGNCLCAKKALVSYYEDIICYQKSFPKHDYEGLDPLRPYFKQVREHIGKKLSEIFKDMGDHRAEHALSWDAVQFHICTRSVYYELADRYGLRDMEGFQEYEALLEAQKEFRENQERERNEKCPNVFNLPEGYKSKSNVFEYAKPGEGLHPTQKPTELLKDLISIYSNPGDLVVDFTMGSGSTGAACIAMGRRFVGIERDPNYFEIAKNRLLGLWEWESRTRCAANEELQFDLFV